MSIGCYAPDRGEHGQGAVVLTINDQAWPDYLTPDEARRLADSLRSVADHADLTTARREANLVGVGTDPTGRSIMAKKIMPADVLNVASGLLSESGENAEYDRAIAEMTCDLLKIGTDSKGAVLALLRLLA